MKELVEIEDKYSLVKITDSIVGWRLFYSASNLYFSSRVLKYEKDDIKFAVVHTRDRLFLWVKPECYDKALVMKKQLEEEIIPELMETSIAAFINTLGSIVSGSIHEPDPIKTGSFPTLFGDPSLNKGGWFY